MARYAIGDIHGCFRTLQALLEKIDFDPGRDRLWLVGDLVNGGPDSVEVLRWARGHDQRIECVLGNHDIYLLARHWDACGVKQRDTLSAVFEAPDREALIEWLRQRPLLVEEGSRAMVHAGLLPSWDQDQARQYCRELEGLLRSPAAPSFLRNYFRKRRTCWRPGMENQERLLCALKVLTMMRTSRTDGRLCIDFAGPPGEAPRGCVPWYELREPNPGQTLYFGHWAALGFHRQKGFTALDSGCVWGGSLTAVRLEDQKVFQQPTLER